MHKIMDKVCESLEAIEHSGDFNLMNPGDRKTIMELVDLKKNILKTECLEGEGEYSHAGDWTARLNGTYGDNGVSYRSRDGRNNGDYSMRGRRRDSMGRYSRAEAKDEMMTHLEEMMDMAPDEKTKEIIRDFKSELKKA